MMYNSRVPLNSVGLSSSQLTAAAVSDPVIYTDIVMFSTALVGTVHTIRKVY